MTSVTTSVLPHASLGRAPLTRFRGVDDLTAAEPPEQRGLRRDGVRLLVARREGEQVSLTHTRFNQVATFLEPGDVVVVNTSATLAAEVSGHRVSRSGPGEAVVIHFATELDDGSWIVEVRTAPDAARPFLTAGPGDAIRLPRHVTVRLQEPFGGRPSSPTGRGNRLWRAEVTSDTPISEYLARYGRPISYGYLTRHWPLSDYQTIFARDPGSAEMPSAGRPFAHELVTELVTSGVLIVPITLHTGVSSQDAGEPPQPERFAVPATTASVVNAARGGGRRVVAVGTTVTRALESATHTDGTVRAESGWTDLVVGVDRPARVVNGLITGWHNPGASHLLLVESIAGAELTQAAYDAAVVGRYRWHEFGDSCLLLP